MLAAPVMFTVDVETDWEGEETRGIQEALPRLLALLQSYGASATFFVVGRLTSLVRDQINPQGPHEVGSHSLTHALLTHVPWETVVTEVAESKRLLEDAGYHVEGFRAPFFRSPTALPGFLARAGYTYNASYGAVYPRLTRSRANSPKRESPLSLPQVETDVLRDGVSPCSLTYLRLYHPFGLKLVSPHTTLFYCHLHEFIAGANGWQRLPGFLRRLHCRHSGPTAWAIVEQLCAQFGSRFTSCRQYLSTQALQT
jgi:hypothetical protein